MIITIDTETTGLDYYHGAAPFFVSAGTDKGEIKTWEFPVDPYTRKVDYNKRMLKDIQDFVDSGDEIVVQNGTFDYNMLQVAMDHKFHWDWDKIRDLTISAHLLASLQLKDLGTQAVVYLGYNIKSWETAIDEATIEARRLVRRKMFLNDHGKLAYAEEGRPDMPSAGEKPHKFDMWLPKVVAEMLDYEADHPWRTVLEQYAIKDAEVAIPIWLVHKNLLEQRGLTKIYNERRKIPRLANKLKTLGITISQANAEELRDQYTLESEERGETCLNIARNMGHDLTLPKKGLNNSLRKFLFDPEYLNLPVFKKSDTTGAPSFDKFCQEFYLTTLPERSKAKLFVKRLSEKNKQDTAISYLNNYRLFWLPLNHAGWFLLHPSLNPTSTRTLRWSSSNPNEQNISKKEGFNLRYCFGPAPGREWWSCDAQNIELRIPSYESGEEALIDLFERPDEPPYFGSNHMLIFHTLHPDKWEPLEKKYGPNKVASAVKELYASTWYQYTKNGNFAVQYGAMDVDDPNEMGTADRAYHLKGAQSIIESRFTKQAALNQYWIDYANTHGYVETMPDRSVDPDRGYPLQCEFTFRQKVRPTVPLNYHVQGTAMWWMCRAMVRCQEFLDELNRKCKKPDHYRLIMQVHDELVFDFPKGKGTEPWRTNKPIIDELRRLMAMGGDDIGLPTPTSCTYHEHNWSKGLAV